MITEIFVKNFNLSSEKKKQNEKMSFHQRKHSIQETNTEQMRKKAKTVVNIPI